MFLCLAEIKFTVVCDQENNMIVSYHILSNNCYDIVKTLRKIYRNIVNQRITLRSLAVGIPIQCVATLAGMIVCMQKW